MKKVKDLMEVNVICVKPDDSIFEVAKIFEEKNITGAPVVDGEKVVGVISVSDIVRFMSLNLSEKEIFSHDPDSLSLLFLNMIKIGKDYMNFKKEVERISKTQVRDLMSEHIASVTTEMTLFEVAALMEKYDVNRLPVIENEKLIGIITKSDLLKALID